MAIGRLPGIITRKSLWKKPYFVNISAQTKIFSKIVWGVTLGPRFYRIMKKTRARKSHASVPLKGTVPCLFWRYSLSRTWCPRMISNLVKFLRSCSNSKVTGETILNFNNEMEIVPNLKLSYRESLMGPEEAVWRKNLKSKISEDGPFNGIGPIGYFKIKNICCYL